MLNSFHLTDIPFFNSVLRSTPALYVLKSRKKSFGIAYYTVES